MHIYTRLLHVHILDVDRSGINILVHGVSGKIDSQADELIYIRLDNSDLK